MENKIDKKEFEEKYDKIIKDFSEKFENENSSKLRNKLIKDLKHNSDNNLVLIDLVLDITKFSTNFSTQLLKYVLNEMLVDKK